MENACEADFRCRIIAYRVRIFNGKFRGQKPIV